MQLKLYNEKFPLNLCNNCFENNNLLIVGIAFFTHEILRHNDRYLSDNYMSAGHWTLFGLDVFMEV